MTRAPRVVEYRHGEARQRRRRRRWRRTALVTPRPPMLWRHGPTVCPRTQGGMLHLDEREGAVVFTVHAVPGSKREGVLGMHGDALKVAVRAKAEKGRANAALVKVLAKACGLPRSAVEVVAGHTSRRKRVRIEGVTAAGLRARLLLPRGRAP